jgi:hypothetical protein
MPLPMTDGRTDEQQLERENVCDANGYPKVRYRGRVAALFPLPR